MMKGNWNAAFRYSKCVFSVAIKCMCWLALLIPSNGVSFRN